MTDRSPFSLEGKVAVVTGGASGLGLATAECLAAAGAHVVVVGRRTPEKLAAAVAHLGSSVSVHQTDVTVLTEVRRLADTVIAERGQVDILVNNAGNHLKSPVEEVTVEGFEAVLRTHLIGSFITSTAFLPYMRERGSGSIIQIASMTSYIGQPYVLAYSTAKAGYLGFVHSLASEVGAEGVRVNAIAPGWIDTPMFRKATDNDPPRKAKILGRTPMARVGQPSDIGWAVVYLSSDAAKFVTGACLPVDGGALIGF